MLALISIAAAAAQGETDQAKSVAVIPRLQLLPPPVEAKERAR
jgi:hypothetical protein